VNVGLRNREKGRRGALWGSHGINGKSFRKKGAGALAPRKMDSSFEKKREKESGNKETEKGKWELQAWRKPKRDATIF